jgi:hypothetical protein
MATVSVLGLLFLTVLGLSAAVIVRENDVPEVIAQPSPLPSKSPGLMGKKMGASDLEKLAKRSTTPSSKEGYQPRGQATSSVTRSRLSSSKRRRTRTSRRSLRNKRLRRSRLAKAEQRQRSKRQQKTKGKDRGIDQLINSALGPQ